MLQLSQPDRSMGALHPCSSRSTTCINVGRAITFTDNSIQSRGRCCAVKWSIGVGGGKSIELISLKCILIVSGVMPGICATSKPNDEHEYREEMHTRALSRTRPQLRICNINFDSFDRCCRLILGFNFVLVGEAANLTVKCHEQTAIQLEEYHKSTSKLKFRVSDIISRALR